MVICFVAALLAAAVDVVPAVRSARITDAKLPPEGYRIRIDAEGKAKVLPSTRSQAPFISRERKSYSRSTVRKCLCLFTKRWMKGETINSN